MIIVKFHHPKNITSGRNEMCSAKEYFSGVVNWQLAANSNIWTPPCDLLETAETYLVRVEVAGMKEQDFEITIDHQHLTINGKRVDDSEFLAFHQMEIFFGEFNLTLDIPSNILLEEVTGKYENGFLLLTLPKTRLINVPISDCE